MARQLGFDLPSLAQLGRADFLVTPSNAMALALIDRWQDWQARKLLLTGPAGSGKTHLTHIWAASAGAQIVAAGDLATSDISELATGATAVEDIHVIAGDVAAETALFHLHNLLLADGHHLLMTGCGTRANWALALPDLKSRIDGTPAIALEPPDDALLAALLAKLFADRQLAVKADVIPYLVARMDRTFDAARVLVDQLDKASLAEKRPISRRLARQMLDKTH